MVGWKGELSVASHSGDVCARVRECACFVLFHLILDPPLASNLEYMYIPYKCLIWAQVFICGAGRGAVREIGEEANVRFACVEPDPLCGNVGVACKPGSLCCRM